MSLQLPTEEQLAISHGIAAFLAANFPLARFRSLHTPDKETWQEFARMGVIGISLPQHDGGMGLSWVDEVLACREAGRYLVSPALVGSILAAHVAARAGRGEVCAALLAGESSAGISMGYAPSEIRVIDNGDLFLLVEAQRVRLVESAATQLRALACIDETVRLSATHLPAVELGCVADKELVFAAQLLAAVFPGTSRSGASILMAMALGVARPRATEFSFLLGIPTLMAAGALKIVSELKEHGTGGEDWGMLALGTVVSAVTAFLVVKWLLRFVLSHTFNGFGWYRIALGLVLFALAFGAR